MPDKSLSEGEMTTAIKALAESLGGVAVARPEWPYFKKQKERLGLAVIAVIASIQGHIEQACQEERERADRLEIENAELEDANRSLRKMRDAALARNLAVSLDAEQARQEETKRCRKVVQEQAHRAEGASLRAKDDGDFDTAEFYSAEAKGIRCALDALDIQEEDRDV